MQKQKHRSLPKTQPTRASSQHKFDLHESFYQALTCPQVSEFSLHDTQKYTHNMLIDYGRIEEPEYFRQKIIIDKIEEKKPSLETETCELTERVPKVFKMNPELSQSSHPTKRESKTSTQKKLNKSVDFSSSKIPKMRLKQVYAISGGSSSKKKLHTRIVKSYVAGGKMQVRLINYPDTSEYQKLCRIPK